MEPFPNRPGPRALAYAATEPYPDRRVLRSLYDAPFKERSAEVGTFFEQLRLRPALTDTPVRSFELANFRLEQNHPPEMHFAQAYHQGADVREREEVELGELMFAADARFLVAVAIVAMPLVGLVTDDIEKDLRRIVTLSEGRSVLAARRALDLPTFLPALEASWALFPDDPTQPHPSFGAYEVWAPEPPPHKYIKGTRTWGGRIANPRYKGEVSKYAAQDLTVAQLRELAEAPARGVGRPKKNSTALKDLVR